MTRPAVAILPAILTACPEFALAEPPRAANPHWTPDGCTQCHAGTTRNPQPIPDRQVDAVCLRCHDGRQAKREPHPIGRPFPDAGFVKPESWPAPDGRLSCATCHDILRACDPHRTRPAVNPAFVRGFDSADPTAFCARCHLPSQAQQPHNPHLMLRAPSRINIEACSFCHLPLIDTAGLSERTGNPRLRSPEPVLCLGCHVRHVDYFDPGHVGAHVKPPMKQYMERRESESPGGTAAYWPLAAGDTVTCSTCHNPHEEGVFPPNSPLARGAIARDAKKGSSGLRGNAEGFCLACHQP